MNHETVLFEAVLAALTDRLATPTETYPSVRCVSRPTLRALLGDIKRELGPGASGDATVSDLLDHLVRSTVVASVPLQAAAPRVGRDRFFVVGLGVSAEALHPVELLQTHAPDGVICYFSALAVHGLTTQPTAHHHVARYREVLRTNTSAAASTVVPVDGPPGDGADVERARAHVRPDPLGQWQFTFQDTPYYLTARDPQNLAATQVRYLHERSRFRVTTLEQTLLDTLHRPMSCGGPAVVFEAWEGGAERLRTGKLADVLARVADNRLSRRVGYMLERFDLEVPAGLERHLAEARSSGGDQPVTLLPGMPYTTADPRWHLLVP